MFHYLKGDLKTIKKPLAYARSPWGDPGSNSTAVETISGLEYIKEVNNLYT